MNILITNLHSAMNLGDEAILRATLDGLERAFPGAHITLAANDPQSWMKFPQVEVTSSFSKCIKGESYEKKPQFARLLRTWLSLWWVENSFAVTGKTAFFGNPEQRRALQAYYDADLVLISGGGIFFSTKKYGMMLPMNLRNISFSKRLGKRIIVLPQSIGPIPGWFLQMIAKKEFNCVDRILVRDRLSMELLEHMGVQVPVTLLADLAFAIAPLAEDSTCSNQSLAATAPKLGVTLMDYQAINHRVERQDYYEESILAALVHLQKSTGALIYLFVQCYGPTPDQDDRRITRRIYERLKMSGIHAFLMDTFNSAPELQAAYRQMDLLIGTRMHSAILALSVGVPVVLIGYQPKASGMMEFFGLGDYCCPIEQLEVGSFSNLVNRAWENRLALRAQVMGNLPLVLRRLEGWENYLH